MTEPFCVPYVDALRSGRRRAYVSAILTAPAGPTIEVIGMVDSGADLSVLPMASAALLGYGPHGLEPAKIQQLTGGHDAMRACRPVTARLRGLDNYEFEIRPLFCEGMRTVWGRADFFAAFASVSFDERAQELTLVTRNDKSPGDT